MGAQRTLGRTLRLSATATTDFLAPDILNRCGRAVPAPSEKLQESAARKELLALRADMDAPKNA